MEYWWFSSDAFPPVHQPRGATPQINDVTHAEQPDARRVTADTGYSVSYAALGQIRASPALSLVN